MHPVRFGHDGWHGLIADDVTFDRVVSVATHAALVMIESVKKNQSVVVGYDRRFLGESFARAIASELAMIGIEPWLIPTPIPTAMLSSTIPNVEASGGIMVTAAHLPATYSGLKFRNELGTALDPTFIREIETRASADDAFRTIGPTASIVETNPVEGYLQSLAEHIPIAHIQEAGLTIAIDPMFGSASGLLPNLIDGNGSRSVEIRNNWNPRFPELSAPDPLEVNLANLRRVVENGSVQLAVALSGDGGRIAALDETGAYLGGDTVSALLAYYLLEFSQRRGPLLRTIGSSTVLERLGQAYDVSTPVSVSGFTDLSREVRDVAPLLATDEYGGIIFRDQSLDFDATAAAVLLSGLVYEAGAPIGEIIESLNGITGTRAYRRWVSPLTERQRQTVQDRIDHEQWPDQIGELPLEAVEIHDGVRLRLEHDAWVYVNLNTFDDDLIITGEANDEDELERILETAHRLMLV